MDVTLALGRPERPLDLAGPLERLRGELVLVTGAYGRIGQAVTRTLEHAGVSVVATDADTFDVLAPRPVVGWIRSPRVVIHLAANKHAPEGELFPAEVATLNIAGTANVVEAFPSARVVLASTCKAADPETVYGASKLVAERIVLNAGGVVARFFNVLETRGNIIEIWGATDGPLPVTACSRYFISLREAVSLLIHCAVLPAGRYAIDPGEPHWIGALAGRIYPGRATYRIPPRRGDRWSEPLHARSERLEVVGAGLRRIVGMHDQDGSQEAAA